MKFNHWGSGEFEVSQLGLGTVALGMPYGLGNIPPPEERQSIALMHRAFEAGINYVDTASAYGNSEEVVGKACISAPFQPMVCTKVTIPKKCDSCVIIQLLSQQLEKSRYLLAMDTLPLVKLHSQQGAFTFPALFDAMAHFTERGWVGRWGVSTYGLEAPLHALSFPELFTALQVPYSALDRSADSDLFPLARKKGVDVVVRSIFLQGLLSAATTHSLPAAMYSLTKALGEFELCAADAGISTAELALRYVVYNPKIRVSLFGTTCIKELNQNLRYYEAGPLPADLRSRIQKIEVADKRLLNPGNWTAHLNA